MRHKAGRLCLSTERLSQRAVREDKTLFGGLENLVSFRTQSEIKDFISLRSQMKRDKQLLSQTFSKR